MNKTVLNLVQGALIAALYAVLTILLAPISFGPLQLRVSELLAVMPYFTPAAIPGLFAGCLVANFYGGLGLVDIIFGSIATLIAAFGSYLLRKRKWLVPLPPIVFNGIIIGIELNYLYQYPLVITMLQVAAGEAIACYILGYPFMIALEKAGLKRLTDMR